jgi:hypothetical protein
MMIILLKINFSFFGGIGSLGVMLGVEDGDDQGIVGIGYLGNWI